jgi:hypothetical protein
MNALPLIISKAFRQDDDRTIELREDVAGQVLLHSLHLDEKTFARKEDDVLCFRSIETPIGDPKRYLGLTILNSGSRHHLKIELTPASVAIFQGVYDAWKARFEESRSSHHS